MLREGRAVNVNQYVECMANVIETVPQPFREEYVDAVPA